MKLHKLKNVMNMYIFKIAATEEFLNLASKEMHQQMVDIQGTFTKLYFIYSCWLPDKNTLPDNTEMWNSSFSLHCL